MPQSLPLDGLPEDLLKQRYPDENVYFFSPVSFKGGCLGLGLFGHGSNYWAALTDRRFLYHAKVQEAAASPVLFGQAYIEREGIIQLKNITSMEIVEVDPGCQEGCLTGKYWELRVNAQGAVIRLPFPNRQKGLEIRAIHQELTGESS